MKISEVQWVSSLQMKQQMKDVHVSYCLMNGMRNELRNFQNPSWRASKAHSQTAASTLQTGRTHANG